MDEGVLEAAEPSVPDEEARSLAMESEAKRRSRASRSPASEQKLR